MRIAAGFIVTVFLCSNAHGDDVSALVEGNETAIGSIYSLQAKLRSESVENQESKLSFECLWAFDKAEAVERIQSVNHRQKPDPAGNPTGIRDILMEGSAYKVLRNWDPADPQQLGPIQRGTCRGEVGDVGEFIPEGYDPRGDLLWLAQVNPRRTLKQAVAHASEAKQIAKRKVNGAECVGVAFEFTDGTNTKWNYEVLLDPNANLMVRKINAIAPEVRVNGMKDPLRITAEAEVLSFAEPKPGVFVPSLLEMRRSDSKFVTRVTVSDLLVNEPLADIGKGFVFPEWCWVYDVRTNETSVYGPNGTVVAHFSNVDEEKAWVEGQAAGMQPPLARKRYLLWTFNLLALVLAASAFYVWRRRKKS